MDVASEVQDYYGEGRERGRLEHGFGLLEALRTREMLDRWLPAPPACVLDVGGAAGVYAFPLAAEGYAVHLIDPIPLHVDQARAKQIAATQGDARKLPAADGSADVVLMLGPLYHLTEQQDRRTAIAEAWRVLRPGGILVAAAISRWASSVDGIVKGYLREAEFGGIVAGDLASGVHRNPNARRGWFTTAYFHRPEELHAEIAEAGFEPDGPIAVEGLANTAADIDALLDDPETRARLLRLLRATEREPYLLGVTGHLLIAGRKPTV